MLRTSRLFSLVLVSSALLFASRLWGGTDVTIFDDLTGTFTHGGYIIGQYSPGNSFAEGPGFTVTGQNYRLKQIRALLSFSSGINDITIRLYDDSGGVPGAVIESWHLVNVLPSTVSVISLDSIKHPKLLPGQRYWIVMAMANPTSVSVWWINTFGLQGPSSASVNGGPFIRNDTTSGFYAFAVTATVGSREDNEQ